MDPTSIWLLQFILAGCKLEFIKVFILRAQYLIYYPLSSVKCINRTAYSRELFRFFCFVSYMTLLPPNYEHKVNSKFHVNCHYGQEATRSFFTRWNSFAAIKINKAVRKFKASKILYVVRGEYNRCSFYWVGFFMFINVMVLKCAEELFLPDPARSAPAFSIVPTNREPGTA